MWRSIGIICGKEMISVDIICAEEMMRSIDIICPEEMMRSRRDDEKY